MEKVLALGINNEYEGDATMWFDLSEPTMLANYIRDNIERGDEYVFSVKEFSKEEFDKLCEED